jgi:hypothetical protein
MARWIDSLKVARAGAEAVLGRAENLGMEVSQARFELEDVTNALTKARTAIHSFTLDPVQTEVAAGLTAVDGSRQQGEKALVDHRIRRLGLAGSTGIILTLVIALLLKIRDIERTGAAPEPYHTEGRPHG